MTKPKVFQLNTELYKVTGIQRVLLDIHEALRDDYDAKIVGDITYAKVNGNLNICEDDYLLFRNPLMLHNSIVIIHERRLLPLMWLLRHIPGFNVKCVYVHHNELYGNKRLSLFPKNIVAISDSGIRNLTDYFGVPPANIIKIHNCVRETSLCVQRTKKFDPNNITIIYPARINSVKRQVEIVNRLKGKLDPHIRILFAGIGPQYEELEELCRDSKQFKALGFRDDIPSLMGQCDFMMLFSKHEGLPISLIEATQMGVPVICNNVGGNSEIIKDGENGIVINDWGDLLRSLNSLIDMDEQRIITMSQNARIRYSDFKFEVFKEKYINLLNRL